MRGHHVVAHRLTGWSRARVAAVINNSGRTMPNYSINTALDAAYIDAVYSRTRLHSTLGHTSPAEFERRPPRRHWPIRPPNRIRPSVDGNSSADI